MGGVWVGTVGAGGLGRPDWVEGWVLGGGAAAPCVGCSLKRGERGRERGRKKRMMEVERGGRGRGRREGMWEVEREGGRGEGEFVPC